MHHDYKWLSKESKQAYGETEHVMPVDLAEFATQYHEHMDEKWNDVSNPPRDGQHVFVLYRYAKEHGGTNTLWPRFEVYDGKFSLDGLAGDVAAFWREMPALPSPDNK